MELAATPPESFGAEPRNLADWRRLSHGSSQRVLIVDDDAATRLLYSVNLQREGLLVLEAADGRRGLARARSERPDLVLTDVEMPGLNGFELAEALRRDVRTRGIPLIFLSGETEAANEARARRLGALAYLSKPVDAPALASLVVRALAQAPPAA